jgi:hypothetical protein
MHAGMPAGNPAGSYAGRPFQYNRGSGDEKLLEPARIGAVGLHDSTGSIRDHQKTIGALDEAPHQIVAEYVQ